MGRVEIIVAVPLSMLPSAPTTILSGHVISRKVVIFYRCGVKLRLHCCRPHRYIGILRLSCLPGRKRRWTGNAPGYRAGTAATVVAERRSVIVNDCATLVSIIVSCDIGRTAFYHRSSLSSTVTVASQLARCRRRPQRGRMTLFVAGHCSREDGCPMTNSPVLEHQVGNLAVVIAAAVTSSAG